MFFKFFRYVMESDDVAVPRDQHLRVFRASRGKDRNGQFVTYRGQKNAVLMSIKSYDSAFTGLIGRFSDTREVTRYDNDSDEAASIEVGDNDYPHTPFVCLPKIRGIAVGDSSPVSATSAIKRLHAILKVREDVAFVATPIQNVDDLRFATNAFKVTEISYETYPVNPHTGALGKLWDQATKRDHIRKAVGRLFGTAANPIKLKRGLASQIQQLQASGHGKVGYTGLTDDGLEIKMPKPKNLRPTSPDDANDAESGLPDVRVNLRGFEKQYPLQPDDLNRVIKTLKTLMKAEDRRDND